jgi:anthranilate synthase component 2
MIFLLDNYDSFTYNLFQYISELGENVKVERNDKITLQELEKIQPKKIIISPGPSHPKNAGNSVEIIKKFAGKIPILGVCLGHQCIAHAYGGMVIKAKEIYHGKSSKIYHNNQGIFKNLPDPFEAVRYHSLAVEKKSLPKDFEITATTKNDIIMGIKHKKFDLEGVQFHPESIKTECGKQLIKNFLSK